MRGLGAGIGLLSLLLGVGLMFYLMFGSGYGSGVSSANKKLTESAQALNGRDPDGRPVTETITFQPAERNSRINGILITTVEPGAAMDQHYGLRVGDVVIGDTVTPFEQMVNNADDCKTFLFTAYQYNRPLEVTRGDQKIRLPDDRNVNASSDGRAAPGTPGSVDGTTGDGTGTIAPQNPSPDNRNNPRDAARDLLRKIETH